MLILSQHLCNELLLLCDRHAFHSLLQSFLILFWHLRGQLVELLLKLPSVREISLIELLLSLLFIFLLLFSRQGRDDLFDSRGYFLDSSVRSLELILLHLAAVFKPLQIFDGLIKIKNTFLLFSEQITTRECFALSKQLGGLGF